MIPREENEEKESQKFLDEFLELYRQLSAWERFQVDFYIQWSRLRRHLGKIVWQWLVFQWELDQKIRVSRPASFTQVVPTIINKSSHDIK